MRSPSLMTYPEPSSMSNDVAAENVRLRAQLSELLKQARRNQQIMQRHQMLDLKFIGAAVSGN